MSKIYQAFEHKKAFIPFITAGDPSLEVTRQLIIAMESAGADLIEIGIPFSDPIAEGIVIQEADERALAAGTTTDKIFDMLKEVRREVKTPMVFMTYINPVFTYGKEKFMKRCVECEMDGIIVPDLPFEEREELLPVCETYGIDLISMIAPTSDDRIHEIAKEAKGFLYCVSSLGVTGVQSEIHTDIETMIDMVKAVTDIPVAVEFGISTPEQAAKMAALADGVIVGSAIVKIVAEHGEDCVPKAAEYVKVMKAAVDSISV